MTQSRVMPNSIATNPIVSLESSELRQTAATDSNMSAVQSNSAPQNRSSTDGPVAILWDIENCPVPSDVRPEDVAGNIRMALRLHPIINGAVMVFSAYGDFNSFPRRVREGCQRTGVKLIDVPNGRKDAADKAILVDMFLFALDNPPPSSIMLISGDVDFAPALHVLGQRGYTVILVIPSRVDVSSALCSAGQFVWDWQSVVRGGGSVPAPKSLAPSRVGPSEIAGYLMSCHINGNILSSVNEEEAVLYRGIAQSCYPGDSSMVSQSLSGYASTMTSFPAASRSLTLASGANEPIVYPSPYGQRSSTLWVPPGDINGLKGQLIKLLELSGGCLPLMRVPAEYQKHFGRSLNVAEYGASKLVNLFKKMGDAIVVDGKGNKRSVYLQNWKATNTTTTPLILLRKDKKAKDANGEIADVGAAAANGGSSDELSDDERVAREENEKGNQGKPVTTTSDQSKTGNKSLEEFRYELQEILVSYSCPILLYCFEDIYRQRYKKPLGYQKLGVDQLEELFDKFKDVVVLVEDPVTKRKFIEAV